MQKNDLTGLFPRREKLLDERPKSYRISEPAQHYVRCGERSDEAISCNLRRLWCHPSDGGG
jgi:hypothetical protein